MSYSRWSNSRWYTYYLNSSSRRKDDQIFSVCYITDFTYKQLKADIRSCISEVHNLEKDATKSDLLELESYMERFIEEVESGQLPTTKAVGL